MLPLADLYGDADHVGAVLDRLALSDVVLVGHSYGGAVITDAAATRSDLAHLVYLAAFALLAGESVMDPLTSLPPETTALQGCMVGTDDGRFTIDPGGAVAAFYAECPPTMAHAAVARLGPQPMSTFTQPVRHGVGGFRPRTCSAGATRRSTRTIRRFSHNDVTLVSISTLITRRC